MEEFKPQEHDKETSFEKYFNEMVFPSRGEFCEAIAKFDNRLCMMSHHVVLQKKGNEQIIYYTGNDGQFYLLLETTGGEVRFLKRIDGITAVHSFGQNFTFKPK